MLLNAFTLSFRPYVQISSVVWPAAPTLQPKHTVRTRHISSSNNRGHPPYQAKPLQTKKDVTITVTSLKFFTQATS